MTTHRDHDRSISAWLVSEAPVRAPDDVLEASRERLRHTHQRPAIWPAWRIEHVNSYAKLGLVAAAVLAVGLVGYQLLPGISGPGGPSAAPSTATSAPPTAAPSVATTTTVTITPFGPDGFGMCPDIAGVDCVEDPGDDEMSFTMDLPVGWELRDAIYVQPADAPLSSDARGAGVLITRGNWLNSEPCRPDEAVEPDIAVGPTANDLVKALDEHPNLDVSVASVKGIGGYTGTYLELRVPDDIRDCVRYQPMEETIYAQGPGQLYRMWIVDVSGIRVVVQGFEYPDTSQQHREEIQAVVDSIQISS